MSLIRRRFSKRAFLAAYPERIANALYQDAVGILKDAKLRQRDVDLVTWRSDNGIVHAVACTIGPKRTDVWRGHWPPGNTDLTPAIIELFGDEQIKRTLPRGLYESGSDYAKRFWKAARRHPADLDDSWASD